MTRVAVVYHSHGGRTKALADAVARGAKQIEGTRVTLVAVDETRAHQDTLGAADAIVFGCPTYMGSASADFKAFMDGTSRVWALQGWRDKLAAGFTHSAAPSGDKLGTLIQLAIFAAQHGMIWIGLGLPPSYAEGTPESTETNRLGSHLGAMAQSRPGVGPLPPSDVATAEVLGRRVAEAAARWQGRGGDQAQRRHPSARDWQVPIPAPGRKNLRELMSRPGRFEHHLLVFAGVGGAQLEITVASEPLYFGHVNISDEYALALPTGDEVADRVPLRTFVSDPISGDDLGRYRHRVGDLVLHPEGYLHWPGRLRPPYSVMTWPDGMRRTALALVFCANRPTAAASPRPREGALDPARAGDVKRYQESAPTLIMVSPDAPPGAVARIASATLERLDRPGTIAPERGGWVVVLGAEGGSDPAPGDVLRIPPGGSLDGSEMTSALLLSSDVAEPDAWPPVWDELPPPPFAPFEEANPLELPHRVAGGAIEVRAESDATVRIVVGEAEAVVPRYWLARTLFRVALHGFRLGYVETYGGLFIDDRSAGITIGLRTDDGSVTQVYERDEALSVIEGLYRAVAPAGYRERLR